MKRRLTFAGVETVLTELENRLYKNAFALESETDLTKQIILDYLYDIQKTIREKHNGLFIYLVNNLIEKVELFGLFFATLDVRQDSGIHARIFEEVVENSNILPENYASLSEDEKIETLLNIKQKIEPDIFEDELTKDTLKNIAAVKKIQRKTAKKAVIATSSATRKPL